jgi:hypothetical protein
MFFKRIVIIYYGLDAEKITYVTVIKINRFVLVLFPVLIIFAHMFYLRIYEEN